MGMTDFSASGATANARRGDFALLATYTAAIFDRALHLNILFALPAAAIAAGVVGVLLGITSLRFKGFYLSLTTLALHFIVIFAVIQYQTAMGGLEGFSLPTQVFGPLRLSGERPIQGLEHWLMSGDARIIEAVTPTGDVELAVLPSDFPVVERHSR